MFLPTGTMFLSSTIPFSWAYFVSNPGEIKSSIKLKGVTTHFKNPNPVKGKIAKMVPITYLAYWGWTNDFLSLCLRFLENGSNAADKFHILWK